MRSKTPKIGKPQKNDTPNAWEKKKLYRLAIKLKAKQGYVPMPDGLWTKSDSSKAMHRDFIAGHR